MRLALCFVAALTAAGCSMTVPVRGQLMGGAETFSGVATGHMDGAGVLTIVSSRGTKCEGNFVYVTGRRGEGVFTCTDGRSGPFDFVSTGTRGTGRGMLSGDTFVFTFGD